MFILFYEIGYKQVGLHPRWLSFGVSLTQLSEQKTPLRNNLVQGVPDGTDSSCRVGEGWEWGRKNWQRREVQSRASFLRGFVMCAVRNPVCPDSDKTSVLSQHRRAGWRRNPGWRMLTAHCRVRQTRTPEAAGCQPSVLVADSCLHPSPSLLDLRSSLGFGFGPRDLSSPLSTTSDLAYTGWGGVISWSLT